MKELPRVKYEISSNPGRGQLDQPQQKNSRPGQLAPTNRCGRHRDLVADEEEVEAAGSAGGAASSFTSWTERKARESTA